MSGSIVDLFSGPSISPAWLPGGAFCFPPRMLWTELNAGDIAAAWNTPRERGEPRDPAGLYIHIPPETARMRARSPGGSGHPYLECLRAETRHMGLPATLRFDTVFIGGGGSGSLSFLRAGDIGRLLGWLRSRFRLEHSRQFVAEVDARRLTAARVRALAEGGVDRVTTSLPPGESGAENDGLAALRKGLRLCRAHGIKKVHIDLPAGSLPMAAGMFREFGADSLAARGSALDALPRGGRTVFKRGKSAQRNAVNKQLADAANKNASVVGVGWGAVSRRRGRLTYLPSGSFQEYAAALLRGRAASYEGARLDRETEMRAHVVRVLEDVGTVHIGDFRRLFGVEPEEAFPEEFRELYKTGKMEKRAGTIRARSDRPKDRVLCSLRFYGRKTLRGLARTLLLPLALAAALGLPARAGLLALKGGTLIDVEDFGRSAADIMRSVVLIEDGRIKEAGPEEVIRIPAGAEIIDAAGKYLVPGLIEGFGTVNNQAYANAYLYMGVTTVVVVGDPRRGTTDWKADPSPARMKLAGYHGGGSIRRDIAALADAGVRVLLIHYGVRKEQLAAIVSAGREHRIPTIGELGHCSYADAVEAGVQSFVHTSRYTADLLPAPIRTRYATDPFGSPARYYYDHIAGGDILHEQRFKDLAVLYAGARVGLIPTASMLVYPYMPFAGNPWSEPAAALLDEKDIDHEPLDRRTGKPRNLAAFREKAAPALLAMDRFLAEKGARFLAGSGADAFGTLPGVSLHTELESLSQMGLSNREVVAAATNNFSLLWGWDHIGKLEKGREADILILSRDPRESIAGLKAIEQLILDGRIIDRKKLLR